MSIESRLSALEADKSASLSPNEVPIKQDISDSDFVYIHNTSTGRVERVSKSVFNANVNNNGVESYYISPEPTPQTENFFIDVIVADNINNRAQQIPQSSKLIYIYTLFQYGGQSFRKIWILDNSNRAYGQGTPPIGAGNLIEFNTQALQQNSVVDLGDIGALVGNETYEEHLRDYINAQDPSIGLINSGTIRADFGGDVREFNFSNVTGDYGLNVNQTEVTDFQLYGESNNEEDAGTIVTNTSQLVNDGEDGTSRFVEEDELGTIAYEDSDQFVKQEEREIPNGIATLDGAGKLKTAQIPDLAITDVVTPTETTIEAFVANNANYTYQQGDVIVIDDGTGDVTHNMYKGGDKSLVSSYSEINATEFAISQINGLQVALDDKLKKTNVTKQIITGNGTALSTATAIELTNNSQNSGSLFRAINADGDAFTFAIYGNSTLLNGKATILSNNDTPIRIGTNGNVFNGGNGYVALGAGGFDEPNDFVFIKPNKRLGVGIFEPTEKVDVDGNVKADKFITNGGDGTNLIDDNGDLVPKSTFATSGELNNAVKKIGETTQTIVGELVAGNFKTTDGNYLVETFSDNRTLGSGAPTLQAGIEVQGTFESVLTRLLMGIEENGEAYLHADNHFTIRGKDLAQLLTDHYQFTNTENGFTFKEVGVSGHTVFKLDPTRFVNIAEVLLPKNSGRIVVSESTTIPSQSVPNLRYSSTTGTVSEIERPTSTFINTSNTGFSSRNITYNVVNGRLILIGGATATATSTDVELLTLPTDQRPDATRIITGFGVNLRVEHNTGKVIVLNTTASSSYVFDFELTLNFL